MSTMQFDPDKYQWNGLQLGIILNLIPPGTTEEDVKSDPKKRKLLKKTYHVLAALGVGKVRGRFVDTPRGLQEKLERATAAEAERRKTAATKRDGVRK